MTLHRIPSEFFLIWWKVLLTFFSSAKAQLSFLGGLNEIFVLFTAIYNITYGKIILSLGTVMIYINTINHKFLSQN